MATGRNCGRLLCFCGVVVLLLLADVAVAYDPQEQRETGVVGSTQELYLRGNTVTVQEIVWTPRGPVVEEREESFEEFERRELSSGYPSDPADPNCDNDPTLCAP